MIKYRLGCASGHEFESWFRAIADYDVQSQSSMIACPRCGSTAIAKQPMAPAVVSGRGEGPPRIPGAGAPKPGLELSVAAARELVALRQKIIATTEDVGPRFADEARKMHFGEVEERQIRGKSTLEEALNLAEDGVPFGIVPPLAEELN